MNRGPLTPWTALLLPCAALLWTFPASAQEEAEEVAAPRKMHVSVPPPQRVQRTAYIHEGFYFRASVGPAWQWTSFNDRGDLNLDLSGNSFAMGLDLMVGVSPSPGIALGVGLLSNTGFDMTLEDEDGADVTRTNVGHFIVGPFFDAFPDKRGGWHLGAEIGFAMSQYEGRSALVNNAFGAGAATWVGHDFWVAPEWSAGLALRLSGAYLFGSEDALDVRSTAITTSLLLSVLYH